MEYAIETIDLVKRYPTSARRERGIHWGPGGGQVTSFSGILRVLRGAKGPFIEALRGVNIKVKKGEVFVALPQEIHLDRCFVFPIYFGIGLSLLNVTKRYHRFNEIVGLVSSHTLIFHSSS